MLLGFIQGNTAVGLYTAGTNLVLYLNVLARMLNYPLYPRMSKAWPDRLDAFRRLRDASLQLIGAVGVPIMVGSLLLAPRLLSFIYRSDFAPAVLCGTGRIDQVRPPSSDAITEDLPLQSRSGTYAVPSGATFTWPWII